MKVFLALLYLLTGLITGWDLFTAWVAAHIAQGGPRILPVYWVWVVGAAVLLLMSALTLVRPRAGVFGGLIGCGLLWTLYGPYAVELLRAAGEPEVAVNSALVGLLLLLAASVLSVVGLVKFRAGKADVTAPAE